MAVGKISLGDASLVACILGSISALSRHRRRHVHVLETTASGEAVVLSTGTPIPAQWTWPSAMPRQSRCGSRRETPSRSRLHIGRGALGRFFLKKKGSSLGHGARCGGDDGCAVGAGACAMRWFSCGPKTDCFVELTTDSRSDAELSTVSPDCRRCIYIYIVMAYAVMAYVVMACVVMA